MRLQYLFWTVVIEAGISTGVHAQAVTLGAAEVPLSGGSAAAFAPDGWEIERRTSGDLNADQRPDSVLVLIEKPDRVSKDGDEDRRRTLVVLLAQPDGTWQRVGFSAHLLYCAGCFLRPDGEPVLNIQRGVLTVAQDNYYGEVGSRYALRVRFEPARGRMRLIGEDYVHHESRFDKTEISTNLLTGRQKTVTSLQWPAGGEETRDRPAVKTRWRTLKLPKYYLEDYRDGLLTKFY